MKDVEFHVEAKRYLETRVYTTMGEAASVAIGVAASTGLTVTIDVCIWSEAGAKAYGGDHGVEQYREDPDASVFERIEVKANALGRIR